MELISEFFQRNA